MTTDEKLDQILAMLIAERDELRAGLANAKLEIALGIETESRLSRAVVRIEELTRDRDEWEKKANCFARLAADLCRENEETIREDAGDV